MALVREGDALTYGVSREGIQDVFNKLHTALVEDAAIKIRNDGSIVEALEAGWLGSDCKVFLENLKALEEKVITQLRLYDEAIADEFYKLQKQWEDFQKDNVKPTG